MKRSIFLLLILNAGVLCSQPSSNYYDSATGKGCDTLKSALKTIITQGNIPQSYSALWGQYNLTDIKPRTIGTGSANVIWDVYSSNPAGTDPYQFTPGTVASGGQQDNGTLGNAEGQLYNREHSVPKSWFSGNTAINGVATDYLFIYPTDKFVNGKRGDIPYGVVGTPSRTFLNGTKIGNSAVMGISSNVFEPIDSFKGDLARSFFYFVTRYENDMHNWNGGTLGSNAFDTNTFPSVKLAYLNLMLQWHNLDPVSQKEIDRNNGAFSYQGNRNPYIDHPEFVSKVWNNGCLGLTTLPVAFLKLEGKIIGNDINIEWRVQNEHNIIHYEVERSFDGISFEKVSTISSIGKQSYLHKEAIPQEMKEKIYYRIHYKETNGSTKESMVLKLVKSDLDNIEVYPNPVINKCYIKSNTSLNKDIKLRLINESGKIELLTIKPSNQKVMELDVRKIPNGIYWLDMEADAKKVSKQIMIQH